MSAVLWFLVIMSTGDHFATTVPMQTEHACLVAKDIYMNKLYERATKCVSNAGDVE